MWWPLQWLNGEVHKNLINMVTARDLAGQRRKWWGTRKRSHTCTCHLSPWSLLFTIFYISVGCPARQADKTFILRVPNQSGISRLYITCLRYTRGRTYAKKLRFLRKKKSRLCKSENAVHLLYAKNSDLTHQNAFSLFVFCTHQRRFVDICCGSKHLRFPPSPPLPIPSRWRDAGAYVLLMT